MQVTQSTHVRLAEHDVSTDSDGAQPEDVAIAKVKHFEFFQMFMHAYCVF